MYLIIIMTEVPHFRVHHPYILTWGLACLSSNHNHFVTGLDQSLRGSATATATTTLTAVPVESPITSLAADSTGTASIPLLPENSETVVVLTESGTTFYNPKVNHLSGSTAHT